MTECCNVNIDYSDRLVAFLIIDGEVYSSDCDHQECLEKYYSKHNIKSEFDYSDSNKYEQVHKAETNKTYQMKNSHEAYGFDLFDTSYGYVLAAHDKKTYEDNKVWAYEYANENDASLGFFVTNHDIRLIELRKELIS